MFILYTHEQGGPYATCVACVWGCSALIPPLFICGIQVSMIAAVCFSHYVLPDLPPGATRESGDKTWKENQHRGLERMDLVQGSPAAQNSFEAWSRPFVTLPTASLSVAELTVNLC